MRHEGGEKTMAITDYDTPRTPAVEEDSLEELRARRDAPNASAVDVEESESYDLPGGEQLDEELTVPVVAQQADEFRCTKCFLVRHRNQRAAAGKDVCVECA
ncbi:hypothetical protein Cme02nite_00910 [Catellatospora methionotrophica]|uniref:dUTPase n=2 Tax=Micromonosporaceae TaxID=28056 RepID=A0A8J3L5A0_9ACTN|nr:hypothetical protein Cme02nite_00910 [Catellatospora methionotrophica]